MVKIDDFHVEFFEKWALYHPGDTVNGTIHLKLNDAILCDAVSVQFFGSARVFWVEREPSGNLAYTTETVYFNEKHQVWTYEEPRIQQTDSDRPNSKHQQDNGKDSRPHLSAGTHEIEFAYSLPEELPTSFEAKHANGYIRYFVKVCITQQEMIKHSRKVFFSVVKPQDLNLMPALRASATRLNGKYYTGSFCFSQKTTDGHISLKVTIPKQGFVPGEPIKFTAEVDNSGVRSIRAVKAHLTQFVAAYATTPSFKSQDVSKILVSVGKHDKIRKGTSTSWSDATLYVPAVVPTFVINDVLEVHYSLKVDVYCGKSRAEVAVELPITIGTVPLATSVHDEYIAMAVQHRNADRPPAYTNYAMNIPPPTYEESITGTSNAENDDTFVPRYAVYSIN